jgi:YihY family inner membrane protein
MGNPLESLIRRIDAFQQRHKTIGMAVAVNKKFGDDRAGYLAALIAYYAFFSLFPLLLVFATVLAFVLPGDASLRQHIVSSALGHFPVIGQSIKSGTLHKSGLALALGIATTLWAGMGATAAGQNAMNDVWGVPLKDRPNFFVQRARSLLMLAVLGTFALVSFLLSGFGSAAGALWIRVAAVALTLVVNLALFMVSYRILTRKDVSWGDVLPGSVFAAVLWTVLQMIGTYYVTHQIASARAVYGTFATVIGLLVWIYLGAQITLYGAEINVVRKERLWPRSLIQPPINEGDKRTYVHQARVEQRRPEEELRVTFDAGSDQRRTG